MDYEQLKIKSYKFWDVYLHENQCYLGRMFILLREDSGIEDFLAIKGEVRDEFFQIGEEVKKVLKALFKPDKMNYAALSNNSPKIHVHVVPRYQEPRNFNGLVFKDSRWGKNYAPYDHSFTLAEETLFKIKEVIVFELSSNENLTLQIVRSVQEQEEASLFRQKHFFNERKIEDPYTWTLGHPEHHHFLLLKTGNVVGYAHIQQWPNDRAALRIIVIDKSEREKGYGSFLMNSCEKALRERGIKILQTEAHRDAVKFYQRLGYTEMPFNDPEGHPTDETDTAMGKRL